MMVRTNRLQLLHDYQYTQDTKAKIESMFWTCIAIRDMDTRWGKWDGRETLRNIEDNLRKLSTYLDDSLNQMASELAEECKMMCGCNYKQYELPYYSDKIDIRDEGNDTFVCEMCEKTKPIIGRCMVYGHTVCIKCYQPMIDKAKNDMMMVLKVKEADRKYEEKK